MDAYQRMVDSWKKMIVDEQNSLWWRNLSTGELKLSHYIGFLRESYHYVKVNAQTQVYATRFFDSKKTRLIRDFISHAVEEIGHEQLALNDLKELDIDTDSIVNGTPLPMTTAFSALPIYMIQFESPLCYFGHLFHLEFIATQNGPEFINILRKLKVPTTAMSFMSEHAQLDPKHNDMMRGYVTEVVKSEDDLHAVLLGARNGCRAFSKMLDDACIYGERDFGI